MEVLVINGRAAVEKALLLHPVGGIEKPDGSSITVEGLNITRQNKTLFLRIQWGFFLNFALLENKDS